MKTGFRTQLIFACVIVPIMVYVTYKEWGKLKFVGFTDPRIVEQVNLFTNSFPTLPKQIGDWVEVEGRRDQVSPDAIAAAKITKFSSALYENRYTKSRVELFLSTGARADLTIHTPQQCYPGAGLAPQGEEQLHEIKVASAGSKETRSYGTFLSQVFSSAKGDRREEVWWSYNATKLWQGEKNPRGQFNNSFAMYKIYVMQDVSGKRPDGKKESDHLSIINALMPFLDESLFVHEKQPAATTPVSQATTN
jgi:hypothetical protein